MEEALDFTNILGESEIENLFTSPQESSDDSNETQESSVDQNESEEKQETTEATVNPEDLFDTLPESVGREDKQGEEDTAADQGDGASPNKNFYSSIAEAFKVDGIFPDLDDALIEKAQTAEDFAELVRNQIQAGLDEKQLRVSKALDNGVEPNSIRQFENTLDYLRTIKESDLTDESDKGELLRRNLIYQDFINKGYTQDRALKYTDRTIDAGTDIEDAKEALQSNTEFFKNKYDAMLKEALDAADKAREDRIKKTDKLKNSILKDKGLMGDVDITPTIRQKALDNIVKPVWKDPLTGDYYTAIQKYEMEHREDFLKYVGLIFTMTDGFKDFDSFVKGKVKKGISKGMRDLERTLKNSSANTGGRLRVVGEDQESDDLFLDRGLKLDV